MSVQFEEESYVNGNSSRTSQIPRTGFLIGLVLRSKLAKDKVEAERVLLILLAVLIIGLGIYLFQATKSPGNNSQVQFPILQTP